MGSDDGEVSLTPGRLVSLSLRDRGSGFNLVFAVKFHSTELITVKYYCNKSKRRELAGLSGPVMLIGPS